MRLRAVALAMVIVAACAGGSPRADSTSSAPTPVVNGESQPRQLPPPSASVPAPTPALTASADAAVTLEPRPSPLVATECVVGRKRGGPTLSEIVAGRRCRVPADKRLDPFDTAEFSISADPPSLSAQRGAHAEIFVQIDVKGTKDSLLQLEMGCLDEPAELSVHDSKGKRIDWVGDVPDMLCTVDVVQVVVPAGDGVSLHVPFAARRYAWKALEASRSDAGPLPAGNFELRLRLPFHAPGGKRVELRVPLEVTR
jgi:hypothetical protein